MESVVSGVQERSSSAAAACQEMSAAAEARSLHCTAVCGATCMRAAQIEECRHRRLDAALTWLGCDRLVFSRHSELSQSLSRRLSVPELAVVQCTDVLTLSCNTPASRSRAWRLHIAQGHLTCSLSRDSIRSASAKDEQLCSVQLGATLRPRDPCREVNGACLCEDQCPPCVAA